MPISLMASPPRGRPTSPMSPTPPTGPPESKPLDPPKSSILKKQTVTVKFQAENENCSSDDLPFDTQLLEERPELTEKPNGTPKTKRRQSVMVGYDEETVIDGTCSGRCLKYFVDLVSITGIKEITRAKHPAVKFLWCVAFIFSFSVTLFYLTRSVQTYFEEPTATKVKIVRNDSYEYPEMLLCPDVWLDRQKALRLGATEGAIQYSLGYLMNFYFRAPPYVIKNYTQAKTEFETWYRERNYSSLIEVFKDFALDSETFFYKCPYCQYKNFSKVIMDETVCYRIPMYWMNGKGTARSATDILEVTVPNRSGNLLHKKKYWRLYVHPDVAIGLSTVRFVQVFPGFSNTIRFTPLRYFVINKPEDPCVPVEHVARGYSTVECAMACANEKKECKTLGSIRQNSSTPNLTEICHYYPPFFQFLINTIKPEMKLIDQIPDQCFKKCPPLCERWLYEASVESHKISSYVPPTDNDSNSEPVPMTRVYLLNQAPLQGGYMAFTEVNTYSFDVMLGNVGGVLSLWLGASIMSFIQITVFIITWCFARQLNRRQKKKDPDLTTVDTDHTCTYSKNGNAKV